MRHVPLVLVLCGVVGWGGLAVTVARAHGASQQSVASGERLFKGDDPLVGRISGFSKALEAEASRCSNCHEVAESTRSDHTPSDGQAPAAPALTAQLLTQEVSRRGGPPSRFDQESFCRLVTTGVDPAYVVVPRTMPRYDMSSSQCQDLWRYLTDEAS
jgi:hypothetical protein